MKNLDKSLLTNDYISNRRQLRLRLLWRNRQHKAIGESPDVVTRIDDLLAHDCMHAHTESDCEYLAQFTANTSLLVLEGFKAARTGKLFLVWCVYGHNVGILKTDEMLGDDKTSARFVGGYGREGTRRVSLGVVEGPLEFDGDDGCWRCHFRCFKNSD
jgi:hypothetical protein